MVAQQTHHSILIMLVNFVKPLFILKTLKQKVIHPIVANPITNLLKLKATIGVMELTLSRIPEADHPEDEYKECSLNTLITLTHNKFFQKPHHTPIFFKRCDTI